MGYPDEDPRWNQNPRHEPALCPNCGNPLVSNILPYRWLCSLCGLTASSPTILTKLEDGTYELRPI